MAANRFEDKVAFVTGAGSGMGRAISLRLASEGARVFGHDINAAALTETEQLAKDAGGHMLVRDGDVSKHGECVEAVADCVAAYGRLDIVGNVAGVSWAEHFLDVTEDGYRKMMGVNVDGPLFITQAVIPHLLETGGTLINIASNAGLDGPGVHRRVLHDQGRRRADDPLARDGVREVEHPHQRDRPGRHQHVDDHGLPDPR